MPNLRDAAKDLLVQWPRALRIITVDVNENEVSHLLEGIELRRQPWQYTMPLVLLPAGVRGAKAKPAPWRGEQGVLPINTDSVTSFVREFMETLS